MFHKVSHFQICKAAASNQCGVLHACNTNCSGVEKSHACFMRGISVTFHTFMHVPCTFHACFMNGKCMEFEVASMPETCMKLYSMYEWNILKHAWKTHESCFYAWNVLNDACFRRSILIGKVYHTRGILSGLLSSKSRAVPTAHYCGNALRYWSRNMTFDLRIPYYVYCIAQFSLDTKFRSMLMLCIGTKNSPNLICSSGALESTRHSGISSTVFARARSVHDPQQNFSLVKIIRQKNFRP